VETGHIVMTKGAPVGLSWRGSLRPAGFAVVIIIIPFAVKLFG
jgi:hypothetical protein